MIIFKYTRIYLSFIMKKIRYWIDRRLIIKKDKIMEAEYIEEELDNFYIFLNDQIVKIELGQGSIILSKKLFDKCLVQYQEQILNQDVKYHFSRILELSKSPDREKQSQAKAVLSKLLEKIKN